MWRSTKITIRRGKRPFNWQPIFTIEHDHNIQFSKCAKFFLNAFTRKGYCNTNATQHAHTIRRAKNCARAYTTTMINDTYLESVCHTHVRLSQPFTFEWNGNQPANALLTNDNMSTLRERLRKSPVNQMREGMNWSYECSKWPQLFVYVYNIWKQISKWQWLKWWLIDGVWPLVHG